LQRLQLKGKLAAALLKAHNLTAVILSDTDVAWLRDPAELLELQPEADILISTDCLSTKTEMQGVINGNRWAAAAAALPPAAALLLERMSPLVHANTWTGRGSSHWHARAPMALSLSCHRPSGGWQSCVLL
jgi:hypothetical protein